MHLKDVTEEWLEQPHKVWLQSTIKNNMHNIECTKNLIKRYEARINHEKHMIGCALEYIGKVEGLMTVGHLPYCRGYNTELEEIDPNFAHAIKLWIDRTLNGYSEKKKCELIYLMMEHCSERLLNPLPNVEDKQDE